MPAAGKIPGAKTPRSRTKGVTGRAEMSIGFRVGSILDEVGTQAFLHAFFSTISYHLEKEGWGTRFPELMNELYQGKLPYQRAAKVLSDLRAIRAELSRLPPKDAIWDVENLNAKPPWGSSISSDIKSLADYFVTSTGKNLFQVLTECLTDSRDSKKDLTVERV